MALSGTIGSLADIGSCSSGGELLQQVKITQFYMISIRSIESESGKEITI